MTSRNKALGRGLEWLCTALMLAGSYVVFYSMATRWGSDINIHSAWATEGNFHELDSFFHHGAHPMWHVFVVLLMRLGLPLHAAAALVTAVCKAVQLPLAVWVMRQTVPNRISRIWAVLLTLVCLLVSPLRISTYNPTVYYAIGTPNCWHSCTQTIALAWMLACVPVVANCYDSFLAAVSKENPNPLLPWKQQQWMGALLFLSLLAKPTFMQAFLPAACLFYLVSWIRHPKAPRFFWQTIACVLPAVLLMIGQYLYYFGIIVPSQGSMILQIDLQKIVDTAIRVVLLLAFPLYTLYSARKVPANTLFRLTLLFTGVAILECLILGESGRRAMDGNFSWGMMGACLMAWVVCTPRFFADMREKFSLRHVPGLALLLYHLASGLYYLHYLMTNPVLL